MFHFEILFDKDHFHSQTQNQLREARSITTVSDQHPKPPRDRGSLLDVSKQNHRFALLDTLVKHENLKISRKNHGLHYKTQNSIQKPREGYRAHTPSIPLEVMSAQAHPVTVRLVAAL